VALGAWLDDRWVSALADSIAAPRLWLLAYREKSIPLLWKARGLPHANATRAAKVSPMTVKSLQA
jgi:hypothetical protein